ncbi:acyl-CoA synthetase [Marinobacter fuscus]|uniref:Long-chain-fatty-acid--CoA ligase n=1 Tax=Marinobacter fuscus TaxID=2109942 RepID=A0A2T1KP63_9GAMM|nr:AMP-binding protein [Marinobacter fuscus]PSF11936.1 acyl-CoA synthetase [Marinobacter fuscus]
MLKKLTLTSLVSEHLERAPESCALVVDHRQFSYRELDQMGLAAAAWLREQGVRPGDRVAVWLVNRPEWLALMLGLSRIGAVLVAVNTRYRTEELQHILSLSGARILIMQPRFRNIDFQALLQDLKPHTLPDLEAIAVLDPEMPLPKLEGCSGLTFPDLANTNASQVADKSRDDDLAILFTTSGTTKMPKLVMHTQYSLASHAQCVAEAFMLNQPGAGLLAPLPFCGTFGLVPAIAALAAGTPIAVMETFDAKPAVELIRKLRLTHLFGSDEMYRRILDVLPESASLDSLRVCGFAAFQTGAEELVRQADARGIPIAGVYGSSEVQALFSIQPTQKNMHERCKGGGFPADPEAKVRIRDTESGELMPPEQSGILEINATGNFSGYFNNPLATSEVIDQDGYFSTGDIGYLCKDGSFVYQTRQGDAIRLSGFLVNPSEIEDVLKGCPGIVEAQVIGADVDGVQSCVAFVIAEPGSNIDADGIRAWLRNVIAPFKVPSRVWFLDAFPVTDSPNGVKIQRAKLREMAAERDLGVSN